MPNSGHCPLAVRLNLGVLNTHLLPLLWKLLVWHWMLVNWSAIIADIWFPFASRNLAQCAPIQGQFFPISESLCLGCSAQNAAECILTVHFWRRGIITHGMESIQNWIFSARLISFILQIFHSDPILLWMMDISCRWGWSDYLIYFSGWVLVWNGLNSHLWNDASDELFCLAWLKNFQPLPDPSVTHMCSTVSHTFSFLIIRVHDWIPINYRYPSLDFHSSWTVLYHLLFHPLLLVEVIEY